MRLLVLSGVSGSGKSTALNALEDIGYYCLDKLPTELVRGFLKLLAQRASAATLPDKQSGKDSKEPVEVSAFERADRFALLVDCRDFGSVALVKESIARLKSEAVDVHVLFLDCSEETVITRFRQTRRPHPLLGEKVDIQTIPEALALERRLLGSLRMRADQVIDTSSLSPHELRREIEKSESHSSVLQTTIESFGFKYSLPQDADLVLDVRFLPNPHYVDSLRPQNGRDEAVAEYVFSNADAAEIVSRYSELLRFLIPRYRKEGKRYFKLCVGCTGGQHRSVAIAEALAEELRAEFPEISVKHRDCS